MTAIIIILWLVVIGAAIWTSKVEIKGGKQ